MITMKLYDQSSFDGVGISLIDKIRDYASSGVLRRDLSQFSYKDGIKIASAASSFSTDEKANNFLCGFNSKVSRDFDDSYVSLGFIQRMSNLRNLGDSESWNNFMLSEAYVNSYSTVKNSHLSNCNPIKDRVSAWLEVSKNNDDAFMLEIYTNTLDGITVDMIKPILKNISVGTFAYYSHIGFNYPQIVELSENQVDPELAREVLV